MNISNNKANVAVQLTKKKDREARGERSVFELEKVILEKLKVYEENGYKVASEVLQNGPPG